MLPPLNACTYGFTARFSYIIVKAVAQPWADGFGFYLKPAAAVVDTATNQAGGYAQGLGVDFITYDMPRHQIRVNNTVLPGANNISPAVDSSSNDVLVDWRTAPGQTGSLALTVNGVTVFRDLPVNYTSSPTDVFTFVARTGGYAETMLLDNVVITPITLKPAANLTARYLSQQGSALLTEVKWDTEPGGIYEFYYSTDLQNWTFSRTFTATGNTLAVTNITQPSTQPRYFYRVARQQ